MVFRWINHVLERRHRKRLPALNWRALYEQITPEIDERPVFLELRNGHLVHIEEYTADNVEQEVVALAVVSGREKVYRDEAEASTKQLAEKLSQHTGQPACALISRDPASFIGFYVRVGR